MLFFILFIACSSLESPERSAYQKFINENLIEKTLRADAKDLVNVRLLKMDSKYFDVRKSLLGFEDSLTQLNREDSQLFYALALNMRPGSQFNAGDFELYIGNSRVKPFKEIAASMEQRSLYSFSYPFHRLYIYKINEENSNTIELKTVWGSLKLKD